MTKWSIIVIVPALYIERRDHVSSFTAEYFFRGKIITAGESQILSCSDDVMVTASRPYDVTHHVVGVYGRVLHIVRAACITPRLNRSQL